MQYVTVDILCATKPCCFIHLTYLHFIIQNKPEHTQPHLDLLLGSASLLPVPVVVAAALAAMLELMAATAAASAAAEGPATATGTAPAGCKPASTADAVGGMVAVESTRLRFMRFSKSL